MKYQEIMDGFDQLFEEVALFLRDEDTVEGDPPLHDLGPRLNHLCASVLRLPMDEIGLAKERMTEFRDTLTHVSQLMDEANKAKDEQIEEVSFEDLKQDSSKGSH